MEKLSHTRLEVIQKKDQEQIRTYSTWNVTKCNLDKVKLQANAVSGLLLKHTWSEGCPQGPFAYLVTYVASHAGIFELIFADLLLSESLRICSANPNTDSSPAPVRIDQFSLEQQCHTFLMHGLAPSTRKTYATAQRKFFNFCLLPVIHKDTGRGQWWILGTSEVRLTPGLGSPLRFRRAWGCWGSSEVPWPPPVRGFLLSPSTLESCVFWVVPARRVAMHTSLLCLRHSGSHPTFIKGTSSRAHQLAMSLNVAKCNLGKVKLQANAVSGLLLKRTWS